MLKCTSVKISFSMPSMFIFTFAFVSKFLSPSWLFLAINRNSVFMHEAKAAAKMSSGTHYAFFSSKHRRWTNRYEFFSFN